jgi:hypothetical protein
MRAWERENANNGMKKADATDGVDKGGMSQWFVWVVGIQGSDDSDEERKGART